jgi:hypothetical protein
VVVSHKRLFNFPLIPAKAGAAEQALSVFNPLVVATETSGTDYWVARADIRYQDCKGLRFYPLAAS